MFALAAANAEKIHEAPNVSPLSHLMEATPLIVTKIILLMNFPNDLCRQFPTCQ